MREEREEEHICDIQYFVNVLKEVRSGRGSRFLESKDNMQHGSTTVYRHSVSVAYLSFLLAKRLHLKVDYRSLIRGALLHDYFLYDWHEKGENHRLHGFYHPKRALLNARKHFDLNEIEEDIIIKHMFPLTLPAPKYKESVIVCVVDKWVSTKETLAGKKKRVR